MNVCEKVTVFNSNSGCCSRCEHHILEHKEDINIIKAFKAGYEFGYMLGFTDGGNNKKFKDIPTYLVENEN